MANDQNPLPEPEHLVQARDLLAADQPEEAVTLLRRHISGGFATARDYLMLGVAQEAAGEGWQAMAALEQAAQMDPADAAIPYQIGLIYLKTGRQSAAADCFERALALRPVFPEARQALAGVRPGGPSAPATPPPVPSPTTPPPAEWDSRPPGFAQGAAAAPTAPSAPPRPGGTASPTCPHCGMETGSLMSCEWCGHALAQPVSATPAAPGAPAGALAPGVATGTPMIDVPVDELGEGSLIQRLLKAAKVLILNPVRAADGGLDNFYNSPNAPAGVIGLFIAAILLNAIIATFQPHQTASGAAAGLLTALAQIIYDVMWVALTALTIAVYNAITGGADNFLGDFGSIALSFAFIQAVTTIASLPVSLPFAILSPVTVFAVLIAISFWRWILQVITVQGATDLTWFAAVILLSLAGSIATWGIFLPLIGAFGLR